MPSSAPILAAWLAAAPLALAPSLARAAPLVYVALGDSTALGVGAVSGGGYPQRIARRLEASGVSVRFQNYGVAGATASDLRKDQLPRALAAAPALVTIGIGTNDLVKGRSLGEFARDLEIVADLVQRTKATVVISNLPDLAAAPSSRGSPTSFARRLAQYNATIQLVAERHGFQVADVYGATRRALHEARPEEVFAADGFHPSALGYERWADAVWPPVERSLPARVQARRPAPER